MNPLHLLLRIQRGEGSKRVNARYEKAKAFLSDLSAESFIDFIEQSQEGEIVKWKVRKTLEYDLNAKPMGLLPPYKNLTLEELLLVFEVCGFTNYAQLGKSRRKEFAPDNIIRGVLSDKRPSLQVKLAIACASLYKGQIIADWLCFEDKGEHIEEMAELFIGKGFNDGVEIETYINSTISTVIKETIGTRNRLEEGDLLLGVIEFFGDEVVTKRFLDAMIYTVDQYRKSLHTPQVHAVLARHVRRLYKLDESLPDSWVLNAIK